MFDHQPYMDRFLAAGGTSDQIRAFTERLTTALDFAKIVPTGEHRVNMQEGEMPQEAAAVLDEWTRSYVAYMRSR